MTEDKQMNINLNINDGEAFFAHEMAINFNPMQFIFDFKCVTPRIDQRAAEGQAVISMKHNVVMVEPYHAKQVAQALSDSIKRYEKEFGKIEKSKALQTFEKKNKQKIDELTKKGTVNPSYLG